MIKNYSKLTCVSIVRRDLGWGSMGVKILLAKGDKIITIDFINVFEL